MRSSCRSVQLGNLENEKRKKPGLQSVTSSAMLWRWQWMEGAWSGETGSMSARTWRNFATLPLLSLECLDVLEGKATQGFALNKTGKCCVACNGKTLQLCEMAQEKYRSCHLSCFEGMVWISASPSLFQERLHSRMLPKGGLPKLATFSTMFLSAARTRGDTCEASAIASSNPCISIDSTYLVTHLLFPTFILRGVVEQYVNLQHEVSIPIQRCDSPVSFAQLLEQIERHG